jgi:hypothetical protein
MTFDVGDRLAIHEVLSLYGHVIDEREWERLGEVFTDDLVYDATGFDMTVMRGLAELTAVFAGPDAPHPLAHHATNVVVTPTDDPDTAHVVSKGLGVGFKGRVGSATYDDVVVRTPDGWRIAKRTGRYRQAPRPG